MPRATRASAGLSCRSSSSAYSFSCLGALQVLPVGIAYSVWTGIGAIGTVMMGAVIFGEALSLPQLSGIALVLAGIVLLKLASA